MKIAALFLKIFLGVGLAAAASSPYVYMKYIKNAGTTTQDAPSPNNAATDVLPTDGDQQTTDTPLANPVAATPSTSTTFANPFRFATDNQAGTFETSMPGGVKSKSEHLAA